MIVNNIKHLGIILSIVINFYLILTLLALKYAVSIKQHYFPPSLYVVMIRVQILDHSS